jgi:predicted aspartyl protease
MKLVFRFKEEFIDNKPIMRPKIPVKFSKNGKSINVIGLLDSGSDFIVIPKELAEYLELKYGTKTEECEGIGGSVCLKYSHANFSVNGHIFHNIPVHVLPEGSDLPGGIIIGREPLFREFDVEFSLNSNRITLNRTKRA